VRSPVAIVKQAKHGCITLLPPNLEEEYCRVLTAAWVILSLKIAVIAVTLLLIASLVALARGKYRLHGIINTVFFALTMTAVIGLEVIANIIRPGMFREYFTRTDSWTEFYIHLCFSIPCAVLAPVVLYTGLRGRIHIHYPLALIFLVGWIGTFVTGVFFFSHAP
jgi:hypothetical protein